MLSEVLFMSPTPDPDAAVRPLQLLLKEHPNSYKGTVIIVIVHIGYILLVVFLFVK